VSSKAEGIENRVQGKIAETTALMSSAKAEIIDPTWDKLQKEHDSRSTDVGVVTAAKGVFQSVSNAVASPFNLTEEVYNNDMENNRNRGKPTPIPTDYTNFSEKLTNGFFDRQTPNNLSPQDNSTDQPTKVIKIKGEPARSDADSIDKDSGAGERIENRVQGKSEERNEFMGGAKAEIVDPTWDKLQKEHDSRSTDVGAVTVIKGAFQSVDNAVAGPSNLVNEAYNNDLEANLNRGKPTPIPTDYTNFSEKLTNGSFNAQTPNNLSPPDNSTDQPTKVIKIKVAPATSEFESIDKDSSVVQSNLLKKG
jgi:hypothetical protein